MKSLAYWAPALPPPPYTWLMTMSGELAEAGLAGSVPASTPLASTAAETRAARRAVRRVNGTGHSLGSLGGRPRRGGHHFHITMDAIFTPSLRTPSFALPAHEQAVWCRRRTRDSVL